MQKPNLLLIIGNRVIRYVNGKAEQEAELDTDVNNNIKIKHLNYFLYHGLDFEKPQGD